MVVLKELSDALEEIESKKGGLRRALLTLMLEWKDVEKHLDLTQTCFKECFNELESRDKHMCFIHESVSESTKELDLIRETLQGKRKEVEDKEREVLRYVDDLKHRELKISNATDILTLREEKLNEKEKLIESMFEEKFVAIENEFGLKEKQLMNRSHEIDAKEEKLKQQEKELKVREEILMSWKNELKAQASNLRNRIDRTMLLGCNISSSEKPMKRSRLGDSILSASTTVKQESLGQEVCCPRAEIHDFDELNFAVDQIWACYDILDGMPRIYAQVKKVSTPMFKLQIVWLEADQGEIDSTDELQVCCGRFRLGSSTDISSPLMFSHQMQYKRDMQGYYLIYPRKGETWAIYRDRDIRCSSEVENAGQFKYEIVEVCSDFVDDNGVRVNYLDNVYGFESVFERRNCRTESFVIQPNELYRFSHKVPNFKLMPAGDKEYFELDPASLPSNPIPINASYYPDKVKVEPQEMDDVFTLK